MTEGDPADVSTNEIEVRPASLRLMLSDFVLIDTFRGFYDFGHRDMGEEPAHKPLINAKWQYDWQSDKLTLHGQEIDPGTLQIAPTSNRDDTERSHVDHEYFIIYMMQEIFEPLFAAIQRDDIEKAVLVLSAEPHDKVDDRFRLVFGNIELTHRQAIQSETPKESISDVTKRLERVLYLIVGLLILIAIELWRR
jgi:hypothetical protein